MRTDALLVVLSVTLPVRAVASNGRYFICFARVVALVSLAVPKYVAPS